MSYSLRKVNDVVVRPIDTNPPKPEEIAGYDLIPLLYANIFLCSKKGGGKTNVTFTLMQHCIDSKTNVIVFCSTMYSDANWIKIREWLEKREQPHAIFPSIYDDDGSSNLDTLIDKIKSDDEAADKKVRDAKNKKCAPPPPINLFGDMEEEEKEDKEEKKGNKKKGPKYFIVFDDISKELRAKKDVQLLLKHMRHYKCKVVISSQFPGDLDPPARGQIDFWCIFKGFGKDRMEKVFPDLDLTMEFEDFFKIYQEVTKEKHHFLYVNRDSGQLRRDFNNAILLPHPN